MINNVTLVGRLTKDPDLKYTSSGTGVATFTLAVNRNFTSADGNREADFINCVIWRKSAESLANMAKKGSLIGVTGRIQTRSYDNQQGQKVYVTEVVADNFQMLESKNSNSSQNTQGGGVSNSQTNNYTRNQQNRNNDESDPFGNSSIDISDDSLPF
ncbi:single-stranded DNA-binding protein [Enterococcus casseliflavus]|uniref:single-stranded DNA-binding protein n=1 Tax=Enterococcus casseliflavus TaxID=37734 RepID=UPI003DA56A7C